MSGAGWRGRICLWSLWSPGVCVGGGGGECETSFPGFSMPLFFVNTSQEAHIRADYSLLCFCSHCSF